jgi:hypothetical protein
LHYFTILAIEHRELPKTEHQELPDAIFATIVRFPVFCENRAMCRSNRGSAAGRSEIARLPGLSERQAGQ